MYNKYDDTFMLQAIVAGTDSQCIKRQIGAALVKDTILLITGYNGTAPGEDNCCEDWSEELQKYVSRPGVIHGEKNIKDRCEELGIDLKGCTLFVTYEPCGDCAEDWVDTGIIRVVYIKDNKNNSGSDILREKGIVVDKYKNEEALYAKLLKVKHNLEILFGDINYHHEHQPDNNKEDNINVKNIIWTEERKPIKEIPYNHIIGETPFGKLLITWKGWKEYHGCTVDESPFEDFFIVDDDLEEVKKRCQDEYRKRIMNSIIIELGNDSKKENTLIKDDETIIPYKIVRNGEILYKYDLLNDEKILLFTGRPTEISFINKDTIFRFEPRDLYNNRTYTIVYVNNKNKQDDYGIIDLDLMTDYVNSIHRFLINRFIGRDDIPVGADIKIKSDIGEIINASEPINDIRSAEETKNEKPTHVKLISFDENRI